MRKAVGHQDGNQDTELDSALRIGRWAEGLCLRRIWIPGYWVDDFIMRKTAAAWGTATWQRSNVHNSHL